MYLPNLPNRRDVLRGLAMRPGTILKTRKTVPAKKKKANTISPVMEWNCMRNRFLSKLSLLLHRASVTKTQETRAISLEGQRKVAMLELIVDLAWIVGFAGIGIAVVTAFTSPPRIELFPDGRVIVQGVNFRILVTSLFLTGFRTAYQGLNWLRKKLIR